MKITVYSTDRNMLFAVCSTLALDVDTEVSMPKLKDDLKTDELYEIVAVNNRTIDIYRFYTLTKNGLLSPTSEKENPPIGAKSKGINYFRSAQIMKSVLNGLSIKDAATEYDLSTTAINVILRQFMTVLKRPSLGLRKDRNQLAALTPYSSPIELRKHKDIWLDMIDKFSYALYLCETNQFGPRAIKLTCFSDIVYLRLSVREKVIADTAGAINIGSLMAAMADKDKMMSDSICTAKNYESISANLIKRGFDYKNMPKEPK